MLTNYLAACAYLVITVSEIERYIGQKSSIFHTPLHSTPQNGASTRRWKNFEDIFIRFGATHERDGRTDRQTDTGWRHYIALMHYASRGKNNVRLRYCFRVLLWCWAIAKYLVHLLGKGRAGLNGRRRSRWWEEKERVWRGGKWECTKKSPKMRYAWLIRTPFGGYHPAS